MDPLSIAMFAILAVLIFFMFRSSQTRKKQAAELQAQIVPGVEIMTNFGLFGTLISVDEFSNVAEVETSPGNIVRVHRQTIAKIVPEVDETAPRSVEEAMELANREAAAKEAQLNSDTAIRHDGTDASAEAKKPARRTAKKASE
jgi:preprotein translocase subunit YajC